MDVPVKEAQTSLTSVYPKRQHIKVQLLPLWPSQHTVSYYLHSHWLPESTHGAEEATDRFPCSDCKSVTI